jgi:cyclic pyranopterin phosphate synthase
MEPVNGSTRVQTRRRSRSLETSVTAIRQPPLIDPFGRVHSTLRISVTDRCNLRCTYCMPTRDVSFLPRSKLLSFEEIETFVRAVVPCGVRKLRLTGGEPLVRSDVPELVAKLASIEGVEDLAMTTNATRLVTYARPLREAGLMRLNISLDAVSPDRHRQMTGGNCLDDALAGIAAAQEAGFSRIRLNAVAVPAVTEQEAVPLTKFARQCGLELRFIEQMRQPGFDDESPTGLTGSRLRDILAEEFGELKPAPRANDSQPAVDYEFADGKGVVGFIDTTSDPFCDACDRLRISADGKIANCLFSADSWDARASLRRGASAGEIVDIVRECLAAKISPEDSAKRQAEGMSHPMYRVGG